RAPSDGEYWFTVVLVDKAGIATPADVTRQPPGLVVVVDTQRPEIKVKETPATGSGPWFRCEVNDANPDPTTVRLDYQRPDGSWRPLEPVGEGREVFAFPGGQGGPDEREWNGKVRAEAADRAGNTATCDFAFTPRITAAPGRVENRVEKPVTPVPAMPEQGPATPLRADSPVPREFVNSTRVALAYRVDQIGPSGVGKVEVWLTGDGGQTWTKACDDPGKRNVVEFDVPGEGTYGVSLVVSNGNGVGDPAPVRGDRPDSWVEVDTTRPTALFKGVRQGAGADVGCLIFSYEAHDKNLGDEPVSIYFAQRRDGPWTPVARGLKNEGFYRWPVPRGAGSELYFRLEVLDLAGNVARVDLPERTVLDQARPRARVLGVTPGPPRNLSPTID
ncbi:MAG TPA: hypothetical protein VKE94_21265, partial [Gemmataceae bacterium]|nr:hypothetical protein [Gemmataceae bacterium]